MEANREAERRTKRRLADADDPVDTRDPTIHADFLRRGLTGKERSCDGRVGPAELHRATVSALADHLEPIHDAAR